MSGIEFLPSHQMTPPGDPAGSSRVPRSDAEEELLSDRPSGQYPDAQYVPQEYVPVGSTARVTGSVTPAYEQMAAVDLRDELTRQRWHYLPRSLTSRLVMGVVALTVLLVATIGACTYISLRSFLYERLDQQVVTAANQTARSIKFCDLAVPPVGRPTLGCNPLPLQEREWIVILDTSGDVVFTVRGGGQNLRPLTLSDDEGRAFAASDRTVRTVVTAGDQVRATSAPTEIGATDVIAVVGLSTDEVHRTMHRLVVLEFVIGGAAIVLAFAATSYGVSRSLRRLRGVTATAQEVAAELSPDGSGLDRRVHVPDDGSEVGQLATSFNTMLSAVETQFAARVESEQRMRQFLADASHELRTPLTSIRGYAELARMRAASGENTDASDDLSRIESEGTRMSRLVEDLLTLARSDQDDTPPTQHLIEVPDLLDDVVGGVRAAYPTRVIDVVCEPGLTVVGDPDQLVRVVRNLLTNACVHTREGGPIRVTGAADGTNVVIQVLDSGPGLPPEEAAHVFERFWRADRARSRARGGSGLGMSIVSSLVRANGGTVRFDSSVEHGSTVSVRLPAATA